MHHVEQVMIQLMGLMYRYYNLTQTQKEYYLMGSKAMQVEEENEIC